jgi:hypothetical protein
MQMASGRGSWMMRITLAGIAFFGVVCLFGTPTTFAQTPPPRIFFTDLISGPNSGGQNNNGTILTIFGKNFGATQGSSNVTIGGKPVASYLVWGGHSKAASPAAQLETISVAIGSAAVTGTVAVTTSAGASTCEDVINSCQFAVRSGNIYCVSTTGSDSNSGTFPSSCWASIAKAKNSLKPGDIAYIENGVTQTATDNYNAQLSIQTPCSASSPCALVAYPGATATVGTTSCSSAYGIRTPAVGGGPFSGWVLSGLNIAGCTGLDLLGVDHWRVINNDFNCPKGSGQTACMHTDTTTYYYFLGNYVHDVGDSNGSIDKYYHGIYFTTNSNHIWAGYNESNNNPNGVTTSGGCRAIQFYSTGGANQYDLHVYNNYIHNSICDGINFSTVVPSSGTVEAYNNVVFHVGTGPDPSNSSSNYSCVVSGGGGSGTVLVYNNTMYDCGGRKTSDAGAIDPTGPGIAMWNNIVYQLSGESYINPNASSSQLSGSNNLWYGLSGGPSQTTNSITVSPLFSAIGADFTLQSTSPAIGAGTNSQAASWDFSGSPRPNPPSLGAFEYGAATTAQKPNPPTNLSITVN